MATFFGEREKNLSLESLCLQNETTTK